MSNDERRFEARSTNRRGLSTLEMVLALPILLFIMALMINFGTMASWRVRGLTAARHAAWSTRWPRDGGRYPRPEAWPARAGLGAGSSANAPVLDDPRVDHPVVRGPVLLPGMPPLNTVRREVLDPSRGMRHGESHLERQFPLLARLGRYHVRGRTEMLGNEWQHHRLGLPRLQQDLFEDWRPVPVLYVLAKAPQQLSQAYIDAVVAIARAPFWPALRPLDNDDDCWFYHARYGTGEPVDFHERARIDFCSLDHTEAREKVNEAIDRIRGRPGSPGVDSLARHVAEWFVGSAGSQRGYYYDVRNAILQLLSADPPPPAAAIRALQADLRALEAKIQAMEAYRDSIAY